MLKNLLFALFWSAGIHLFWFASSWAVQQVFPEREQFWVVAHPHVIPWTIPALATILLIVGAIRSAIRMKRGRL